MAAGGISLLRNLIVDPAALLHIKEQERELFELKNQVAAMRDIIKDASSNFARMFSERVESFQSQGGALNDES